MVPPFPESEPDDVRFVGDVLEEDDDSGEDGDDDDGLPGAVDGVDVAAAMEPPATANACSSSESVPPPMLTISSVCVSELERSVAKKSVVFETVNGDVVDSVEELTLSSVTM